MKLAQLEAWKQDKQLFRVSFERRANGMLYSEYMPERDETLVKGLDKAWQLAADIAQYAPNNIVNIYVIDSQWRPVVDYRNKMFRAYP